MNDFNIPEVNLPRVVVVGGGFGGMKVAQKLRKEPVQVVLLDKNNYHTFQPLLYQVATGGLEPDSIAFPLRKLFKDSENIFFRMAELKEVDTERKLVKTDVGRIRYDFLVLATGSVTNFFGNDEISRTALGMKNIPEALDLRSLILQNFEAATLTTDVQRREALMNFVIVGAGPTGVETAGALSELKKHILPNDYPDLDIRRMQIHLIEAIGQVLPGMSRSSSENALKSLEKLGVNVWLNTMVTGYDGEVLKTNNGREIHSRTVIWSAGVKGAVPEGIAEEKIARANRIKTNAFLQVEGHRNVFAIGDVAYTVEPDYPQGHPMVAQVAIQGGEAAASNILSLIYGREPAPFHYDDKGSMATIGRNKAVVDIHKLHFKGRIAWFMWMLVHLLSLAGFRNKIVTFFNWVWNYVSYDRGTRLIIRPFKANAEQRQPGEKTVSEIQK